MQIAYASLLPSEPDDRFLRPPLFAGYLSAFASANRPGKDSHDIVDAWALQELPDLNATADRLLRNRPELIALTVFVWNHRRVAKLCRKLRHRSATTKLVLGGPEVAFTPADAMKGFDADWVCSGEGEIPFLNLLNELDRNRAFAFSLPGLLHRSDQSKAGPLAAPMVRNLDDIPSPYLTGHLALDRDGFVDLETTRGCPYRCRFCLYGKTFDSLRHFSLERTERDVRYAIENGATDIYLMDPTFIYPRERCRKVCKILARLNPNRRVDFHTEARAEVMDEALADDFWRAGIKSIEIGLQSTSKDTLKLMKRGLGTGHFLEGCKLLFDRGITTEIGMIAGLPGDTAQSVRETASFVMSQSLGQLTVHRLQMLPGSEYYKMADELGLRYDHDPPYFIESTPTMSKKQIVGVVDELESAGEQPNEHYDKNVSRRFDRLRRREKRAWTARSELLEDLRTIHCEARKAHQKLNRRCLKITGRALPTAVPECGEIESADRLAALAQGAGSQLAPHIRRYLTARVNANESYCGCLPHFYRKLRKRLLASTCGKRFVPLDFNNGVHQWLNVIRENRHQKDDCVRIASSVGPPESTSGNPLGLAWVPRCWRDVLAEPETWRGASLRVNRLNFEICVLSEVMLQLEIGTLRVEEASRGFDDSPNRKPKVHVESSDLSAEEEMGDPAELQISGTVERQTGLAVIT